MLLGSRAVSERLCAATEGAADDADKAEDAEETEETEEAKEAEEAEVRVVCRRERIFASDRWAGAARVRLLTSNLSPDNSNDVGAAGAGAGAAWAAAGAGAEGAVVRGRGAGIRDTGLGIPDEGGLVDSILINQPLEST